MNYDYGGKIREFQRVVGAVHAVMHGIVVESNWRQKMWFRWESQGKSLCKDAFRQRPQGGEGNGQGKS